MVLTHRPQVHFRQHRVAAADRHQRQRTEHDDQLQVGAHALASSRLRGHAQISASGATMPSTPSSGQRSTPFSTNANPNNATGTTPVRHFFPVLITIATVSATAAADAPCRTPLTAGTSLNWKYSHAMTRTIASGIKQRPTTAATAPGAPRILVPTNTAMLT